MLSKIKEQIKDKDKKRILSNFFSLSILQGANYILPFITLPYLVRVLGPGKFGLVAFAQSFIQYFNILTDYGFNLTATREISVHRENKEKITEIFSSVISIKFLLMLLSFIVLSILVFSFQKFSSDWKIYFFTFGVVVGQMLFPQWFFQGMESMKYITFLNVLSRTIFAVAIFIFVRTESQYWMVPILTSIGMLIAGVWSLYLVKKNFGISFKFQKIERLKYYFAEGWHVFISGVFTSIYTVSTTFILGLFSNNTVVGYYALAEKLVKAAASLFVPVNNAVYPYIAKLIKKSETDAKKFIKKIFLFSSAGMGLISIFTLVAAGLIILLIGGKKMEPSISILRILSFFPLIITMARIFSTDYLINFRHQKELPRIYLVSAVLSLVLSFSLVPLFHAVGSAISVMVTELFATVYMAIIVRKKVLNVR